MQILLTNDDGIEATGIGALAEALDTIGEVTVVAPAEDQSAVGRTLSRTVEIEDHEAGYAVHGTPADCTIAGLRSLCPDTDLVVAGCNRGANLSAYTLGRSGTVSAAVEATFFDVPAMAVSLYIPRDYDFERIATDTEAYEEATRATTYLADRALTTGVFEQADYLNVNAPVPGETSGGADMVVTRPSPVCDVDAVREADSITIRDRIWDRMADGDIPDDPEHDRRAVMDGHVSVSPLTAPHTSERHDPLDTLAADYRN
jgi:5'-nucleotidase